MIVASRTTGRRLRRGVVVTAGALLPLSIWLLIRPDLAGPRWSEGRSIEMWLALEAVAAVLIGIAASEQARTVRAVVVGWGLQIVHFAVLGDHSDDTLWGVGMFLQALFAAVAVGLAVLASALTRRARRRTRVTRG